MASCFLRPCTPEKYAESHAVLHCTHLRLLVYSSSAEPSRIFLPSRPEPVFPFAASKRKLSLAHHTTVTATAARLQPRLQHGTHTWTTYPCTSGRHDCSHPKSNRQTGSPTVIKQRNTLQHKQLHIQQAVHCVLSRWRHLFRHRHRSCASAKKKKSKASQKTPTGRLTTS